MFSTFTSVWIWRWTWSWCALLSLKDKGNWWYWGCLEWHELMRSPVRVNCSVVAAGPSSNAPTEAERVLTLMSLKSWRTLLVTFYFLLDLLSTPVSVTSITMSIVSCARKLSLSSVSVMMAMHSWVIQSVTESVTACSWCPFKIANNWTAEAILTWNWTWSPKH